MPRAEGGHRLRVKDLPPTGPLANRARANLVEMEARRAEALKLKVSGLSYRDIGSKLGVDESTVRSDVMVVTARNITTANETWVTERTLSLQRIDKGIEVLWPQVEQGDLQAHKTAQGWEALRIKMLGLDRDPLADTAGNSDERDQRIVKMLAQPSERMRGLLGEAIRTPGSTLLQVIEELMRAMPVETTAESVE